MKCIICNNEISSSVDMLHINKPIASDCRNVSFTADIFQCQHCQHYQKNIDAHYLNNINEIYTHYRPYSVQNGKEQLNFTADIPFTRCSEILKISEEFLPHANAQFIDIGTGSGVMLEAVSQRYSNWTKSAHDVSGDYQLNLTQKYNLASFYKGNLSKIDHRFDIITLIHVLEHITSPPQFLDSINALLSNNGIAVIQVPNIAENEWDFSIYDHVSHFTKHTLKTLLDQHFKNVFFPIKQLNKEITVLVSNTHTFPKQATSPIKNEQPLLESFNLKIQQLKKLPACHILGTGPAASFCAHFLGEKFLGWVDEDPLKIGKVMANKTIQDASELHTSPIFLPYPLSQVEQIKNRLPQNNYIY